MKPTVSLVRADDPSWDAWLRNAPHDVFHRRGYHRYSCEAGAGEPHLFVSGDAERGLLWPCLVRPVEDGTTDVTSVYGYPGPLAWGSGPQESYLAAVWEQLVGSWRDLHVVSVFTRFHPLLDNAGLAPVLGGPAADAVGAGGVLPGGQTVSIDCTLGDKDALAGYAKVLRQEVAAARRAGLETTEDVDWACLHDFVRLYRDTMDRSGAHERYFVDASKVLRLRELLDGDLHLLVTRADGVVAAAGLFTEHHGVVQAFLVGTEERLRASSPLKVLLDDVRRWAHARGSTVLHIGGGRGGTDDTLFAFKRRFSPRRHQFATGRWILDAHRYRELTEAREREAADVTSGFFPAYRAEVEV